MVKYKHTNVGGGVAVINHNNVYKVLDHGESVILEKNFNSNPYITVEKVEEKIITKTIKGDK